MRRRIAQYPGGTPAYCGMLRPAEGVLSVLTVYQKVGKFNFFRYLKHKKVQILFKNARIVW